MSPVIKVCLAGRPTSACGIQPPRTNGAVRFGGPPSSVKAGNRLGKSFFLVVRRPCRSRIPEKRNGAPSFAHLGFGCSTQTAISVRPLTRLTLSISAIFVLPCSQFSSRFRPLPTNAIQWSLKMCSISRPRGADWSCKSKCDTAK